MKPGSKEIDTPGSFRADSKAMLFKPMQTGQKKAPVKNSQQLVISDKDSTKIKDAKAFTKGTEQFRRNMVGNDSGKIQDKFEEFSSYLRSMKKKYGIDSVRNIK